MKRTSRRFNSRIHTRERAEETFDLPVVAEIPRATWHGADGSPELEVSSRPDSDSSQAYRRLAAQIDRALRQRRDEADLGHRAGFTILITSAHDEPARSFVAVNLAAVFADGGDRVIVATTRGFGGGPGEHAGTPGNGSRARVDSDDPPPVTPKSIVAKARPSWLPGVSSLGLGELFPTGNVLTDFGAFTDAARQVVDYLVLEAPLLAATEGRALLSTADLVVVVCESGHTSTEDGSECKDLLTALTDQGDQSVLGLVLANT